MEHGHTLKGINATQKTQAGAQMSSETAKVAEGVRPPRCAHPPLPDRRVPYKSSIMHVVWISVSTHSVE